jgi:hypothetical protein
MDDNTLFGVMIGKLKSKVEKLENLCESIPEDIETKRANRELWYSWHNLWKKAWISKKDEKPDLTPEEIEKLKEETSVTKRYTALDI